MRYVLATFVVTPVRWIERYGWRRGHGGREDRRGALLPAARPADGHPRRARPTSPGFADLMDAYERETYVFDPKARAVADATLDLFVTFYPRPLRRLMRRFAIALLDDHLRATFGYPPAGVVERRATARCGPRTPGPPAPAPAPPVVLRTRTARTRRAARHLPGPRPCRRTSAARLSPWTRGRRWTGMHRRRSYPRRPFSESGGHPTRTSSTRGPQEPGPGSGPPEQRPSGPLRVRWAATGESTRRSVVDASSSRGSRRASPVWRPAPSRTPRQEPCRARQRAVRLSVRPRPSDRRQRWPRRRRSGPLLHPLLGRRAPQHAGRRGDVAAGADRHPRVPTPSASGSARAA